MNERLILCPYCGNVMEAETANVFGMALHRYGCTECYATSPAADTPAEAEKLARAVCGQNGPDRGEAIS